MIYNIATPLPSWVGEIKSIVRKKVANALLPAACRDIATQHFAQMFFITYWPIVDAFADLVGQSYAKFGRSAIRLLHDSPFYKEYRQSFEQISDDEKGHRAFWLHGKRIVGLSYADLFAEAPMPQMLELISLLESEVQASTAYCNFVAVEMVAETVSIELLSSDAFRALMGKGGLQWFYAHAGHNEHGKMSHEEMLMRLALGLNAELDMKLANAHIQRVTDLFVGASDSSYKLAIA